MSNDEDSNVKDTEGDGGNQEKKDKAPNASPSMLPQQLEKPTKDADADARAVPPHLRVRDAVEQQQHVSYEPQSAEPPSAESVDMTTFNPVFVHRAEQETQKRGDKKEGQGKQKENKKRAKVIVSFEDDEGAALVIAPQQVADKDKDKDKARKTKRCKGEKEGEKEKRHALQHHEGSKIPCARQFARVHAPP